MIKVNQKYTEKGRGDCWRAAIASLLELELEAVPHFILHGDYQYNVFTRFLESLEYNYTFVRVKSRGEFLIENLPQRQHLHKKAVVALVPSRNYKDVNHCVLINSKGKVIHDPSPKKNWQGANVFEEKAIIAWYKIKKR